jgi:DNA helicase HerA-like ATPase
MIRIPLGQGVSGPVSLAGPYANRHGLIAGATGTGKTYTLAALSEGFSAAGVPVFLCDVKGDLAGLARGAAPVQFLDVYGELGAPVRVPLQAFGADLLARVLALSPVQTEVLQATFAHARQLATIADLARALDGRHHGFRATPASVDSIRRALITFRAAGADSFFGRPAFDLATLEAPQSGGRGLISILAAERLIRSPDLYAAFLLWLLGDLYARAPEVGDVDRPRLVLIFDEAHLMFRDAPPALIRRVESTVRLIRSKGIGVYFASQSPADIPPAIAAQLGNRVQHAMRAATLADRREIQGAADCLPINPKIRAAEKIATMATGQALVSTLDSSGKPTPVDLVRINAPCARLGPLTAAERATLAPGQAGGASAPTAAPKTAALGAVRWPGAALGLVLAASIAACGVVYPGPTLLTGSAVCLAVLVTRKL